MNKAQLNNATEEMIKWLSHPAELGSAPAQIEFAKTFEACDMTYYIFKYKPSSEDEWLLGVCGGYEGDSEENCGHTFSNMEEYDENTAVEKAIELVDMLKQYCQEQAEAAEERKNNPGTFVNYVLLREPEWDKDALLDFLKEKWGIEDDGSDDRDDEDNEEEGDYEEDGGEDNENEDSFVISYQGAIIAVSLMPGPVPYEELEDYAARNYRWHEGINKIKEHTAHLLVVVIGRETDPREAGTLLVKTVSSCCGLFDAIGIYTGSVVLERDFYMDFAEMAEDDVFPLYNLVWFGLYNGKAVGESGMCGYTEGMRNFGYDEIEVIGSEAGPEDLVEFLSNVAEYVITEEVVLNDGETIGFSEDQKLPITRSGGVAVEGDSLKIEF